MFTYRKSKGTVIKIVEYTPEYQSGIDEMMVGIQKEYPEQITSSHSTRIYEVYMLPDQKYWIAMDENKVAGTIGIVLYSNQNAVVKRMMVDKNYRGSETNTSALLLEKSFEWAKDQGAKHVFLGTMLQFKAAQKFYLKKGFREIRKEDLPSDYNSNPMDSVYYKRDI
jgi:N-acetylglutamate synthase-like GNAT family acetyltransferase